MIVCFFMFDQNKASWRNNNNLLLPQLNYKIELGNRQRWTGTVLGYLPVQVLMVQTEKRALY